MEILGTECVGVLGEIPLLSCEGKKPALSNNGDNTYHGQAPAIVDGLGGMLYSQTPDAWRDRLPSRCGHVRIRYANGDSFLAWAGSSDGKLFGFS